MNVIPFNFDSLSVRVIQDHEGAHWFVASDIARALNHRDAEKITHNLDDDERGTHIVGTPSGDQEMTVINESGMYAAILKSRKPEARRFKKWVTSEVLPSIRKTGRFAVEEQKPVKPEYILIPTDDMPAQIKLMIDTAMALGAPLHIAQRDAALRLRKATGYNLEYVLWRNPDQINSPESIVWQPAYAMSRVFNLQPEDVNEYLESFGWVEPDEHGRLMPTERGEHYVRAVPLNSGKWQHQWNTYEFALAMCNAKLLACRG